MAERMSPKRRNTASGVITFHIPFHVSLLKSQECMADSKDASESRRSLFQPSAGTRSNSRCVRAGKRDEASPSGPQPSPKQDWFSYASLRRLQAKMEAENQQRSEIIQSLADTENVFLKELESFLNQRDVAELRRKELLHKHWTECVWMPLQRTIEQHVSSCSAEKSKRWQAIYNQYLHHCNSKGFVFLDTGDLREYNPFLNLKNKHCFKLHEKLKEKRTARSHEGYEYTSREVAKFPQSDRPLTESVTPQASTLPHASSYYHLVPTSRQTAEQDEVDGRTSSRLDTIPLHISAAASPDGRCHQSGCWFSR